MTTLFYVIVGCTMQFVIGTGLAFLCSQPISGKNFFRVLFFIPLMITPLGVGYAFKMVLDITKGPLQPLWDGIGLQNWAWSTDAWAARWFVILGDSWQWIPFIFIVMLAALENVSRDQVEAAQVDGASSVQIFREITWPQIVPVAVTVILIRMIEAFKIVDLPNIMTSGGPGIATESMTLHSYFLWRANDMGSSAAVAYLLLILTVVVCASFFNYVVLGPIAESQMSDVLLQVREVQPQPDGAAVRAAGRRQDVARRQGRRLQPAGLLVALRHLPDLLGGDHRLQGCGRRQPGPVLHSLRGLPAQRSTPGACTSRPIPIAISMPSAGSSCCYVYNSFAFIVSPVVHDRADGAADLQGLSRLHQFAGDRHRLDRALRHRSAAWRPMRWPASSTSRSSATSSCSCCSRSR